ncbi:MAG: glycosyltransferase WbuB, partial [Verrucomicrobiaceae bacterium]
MREVLSWKAFYPEWWSEGIRLARLEETHVICRTLKPGVTIQESIFNTATVQPVRILFLNQYFPPDPAPTGILFGELAERLRAAGHETEFVSANESYRTTQRKGGRMRREATALLKILWSGFSARRPDVVISGSSPPCLLVAATLIAMRHRAASVHWAMDLYPELAVSLGEIPGGLPVRGLSKLMGWCYRQCRQVVALDADMARHLAQFGTRPVVIRPWVFAPVLKQLAALDMAQAPKNDSAWTWIYSGNLGRAHEWKTLLEAQALVERQSSRIRLRFQGGGPSWPTAQARAVELGLKNCEWLPYVEESELPASLLRCNACVVTQRPEAQAFLWPSKLGLVLSLPRPVIWVGPPNGAIAESLRQLPHAGIFAPGQAEELASWVLRQDALHSTIPPEA